MANDSVALWTKMGISKCPSVITFDSATITRSLPKDRVGILIVRNLAKSGEVRTVTDQELRKNVASLKPRDLAALATMVDRRFSAWGGNYRVVFVVSLVFAVSLPGEVRCFTSGSFLDFYICAQVSVSGKSFFKLQPYTPI